MRDGYNEGAKAPRTKVRPVAVLHLGGKKLDHEGFGEGAESGTRGACAPQKSCALGVIDVLPISIRISYSALYAIHFHCVKSMPAQLCIAYDT